MSNKIVNPLDVLEQINCLAFIEKNGVVNENQVPIEFRNHKFLIQPYTDNSPELVAIKCSQIGFSTLAIIRAIHMAKFMEANVIYTLPSKSVVKDFVSPKVDPLIESNPYIKAMIGQTDSTALKSIGKRFLYFRGSWEQGSAISISAHILINDEVDRSNPKVLRTYKTRLDAAKADRPDLGWVWQFSNPSIPGAGVDEKYQLSDQKVWKIRCPHCNRWQTLDYPESVNFKTAEFICKSCFKVLTPEDRRKGLWVKKFQDRSISGYHFSQMMVPWIPASKIIEESKGDQSVFYNFTLGLPFISKDQSVGRQTITNCITPDVNTRTNVAMGVDNGIVKTYVVGNKQGIFRVGETESWEEIEAIRNQYNAVMVIDANPYPNQPKKLVERYRGKVYIHYYVEDKKQVGTIRWGEGDGRGVVESDRTKIIDQVVSDLTARDITFNLTLTDLDQYINHWGNMYRVVKENQKGMRVAVWEHIEGKPDHFAHATIYWRIALEKTLITGGIVRAEAPTQSIDKHPIISSDQTMPALDLQKVISRSGKKHGDWKTR